MFSFPVRLLVLILPCGLAVTKQNIFQKTYSQLETLVYTTEKTVTNITHQNNPDVQELNTNLLVKTKLEDFTENGNSQFATSEQNCIQHVPHQLRKNVSDQESIIFQSSNLSFTFQNTTGNPMEFDSQNYGTNISKECLLHLTLFKTAYNRSERWAEQMEDAAGREPSGVLNGGYYWLGDYDECRSVKAYANTSKQLFEGSYCIIRVVFPLLVNPVYPDYPVSGRIAICIPDSCSDDDAFKTANVEMTRIKAQYLPKKKV